MIDHFPDMKQDCKFVIDFGESDYVIAAYHWCITSFGAECGRFQDGRWYIAYGIFYFKSEDDYIVFKLTWY